MDNGGEQSLGGAGILPAPHFRASTVAFSLQSTLGEIDRLLAAGALVRSVEFIRKDFEHLSTFRTLTGKGCKILVLFEPRAMHRCAHGRLLF